MTREYAIKSCRFDICKSELQVTLVLNEVFDYFEQRIAELEAPNSCDCCKWHVPNDKYRNYCHNVNSHICVRYDFNDIGDFYELKETT